MEDMRANGSGESAFAESRCYVNLVVSAARRKVRSPAIGGGKEGWLG